MSGSYLYSTFSLLIPDETFKSSLILYSPETKAALLVLDKEITFNSETNHPKVEDTKKNTTYTEDTLQNKGWTNIDVARRLSVVDNHFNKIKDIRKFNEVLRTYTNRNTLEKSNIPMDEIIGQLKVLMKCTNILSLGLLDHYKYLLSICNKMEEKTT